MIDIVSAEPGQDLGIYDTQTQKAANILAVQLGSLEYAPALGIDLAYFLTNDFKIQTESFIAYCTEVLANNGINVNQVIQTVDALSEGLTVELTPDETSTGMIVG